MQYNNKERIQQWLISKVLLTSNGKPLHDDGILNQFELKSKKLKIQDLSSERNMS